MDMETSQFKDVSAGDFEGLVCIKRHFAERYLGMRVVSDAMTYGIQLHECTLKVNQMRMDKHEPERDEIIKIVQESDIPLVRKAMKHGAEESLLWWAENTSGTQPIDAERSSRVKVLDRWFVFKPDLTRMDSHSLIHLDDYKSLYIPDGDIARMTPRFMAYAAFGSTFYGVNQIQIDLWNLGQQYSIALYFDADDLDRIKRYMGMDTQKVIAFHDKIVATEAKDYPTLLETLTPTLNGYCPSCPIKVTCPLYRGVVLEGVYPEGTTASEKVDMIRIVNKIVSKAKKELEDDLKGEVIAAGTWEELTDKKGKTQVIQRLIQGEYSAIFKVQHQNWKEQPAKPAHVREVRRLLVAKGESTPMKTKLLDHDAGVAEAAEQKEQEGGVE